MITETQTSIVVLQLTDELLAQLQPFLAGLEFTAWTAGQRTLCLTMHGEVYAALVEHVGTALDYDVHWQSNEYEPDGFVERVRPLELTNGILVPANCRYSGTQILANRVEVACACRQIVALI